jgi:hypothetical protein
MNSWIRIAPIGFPTSPFSELDPRCHIDVDRDIGINDS